MRTIDENQRIFDSWFENWLLVHVPKLLKQQKWYHSDDAVKSGDIVLFLENEGSYRGDYKYGIVKSVTRSKDGLARKACIQYKNNKENTFRETNRSIRSIVLIHQIDETNITAELGRIANNLDIQYSNLSN